MTLSLSRGTTGFTLSVWIMLGGCDPASPPTADPAGFQVEDSAGVRIVENRAPEAGPRGTWAVVDPEPGIRIGEIDGDEPYLLTWIVQAFQAPSGEIVVADLETREIRIFDEEGAHVHTIGGRGDGPGEFRAQPRLGLVPPDTIVVWDAGSRRLTWFILDGRIMREESLVDVPIPITLSPPPWRVLGAGTLMHMDPVPPVPPEDRRGLVQRHRSLLVRVPASPELTSIQGLPGGRAIYGAAGQLLGLPDLAPDVASTWDATSTPPSIVVADDPDGRWVVSVYDLRGNLVTSIRAAVPRVAWSDGFRDRERSRLLERIEQEPPLDRNTAAAFRSAVQGLPFPDSARAIDALVVDRSDRLWVRRWSPPWEVTAYTFDVIDANGRWLGSVEMDRDWGAIASIGDDHVLFVGQNEFQVPEVRWHSLRR